MGEHAQKIDWSKKIAAIDSVTSQFLFIPKSIFHRIG